MFEFSSRFFQLFLVNNEGVSKSFTKADCIFCNLTFGAIDDHAHDDLEDLVN